MNRVPPMAFTDVTNSDLSADLGNRYEGPDGKRYRLVQADSDISSAAKAVLVTALSSAVPTWVVDTTTTANDHLAVGVVPSDIVTISDTSGQIDEGSYFFVQDAGHAVCVGDDAIADGADVGTAVTAGEIDDASVDISGAIGVALEAIASTGDINVLLKYL